MADNVIIPAAGTGTSTPNIATDDVGGVQHQRVKIEWGTDGTANDVTPGNPLPVADSNLAINAGGVTETPPATDTASSGSNGRLQRIAQRLTTLIGLLPTSLGQKTMANGLAVTIASDQSTLPVSNASLPLPTGAATSANQTTDQTLTGAVTETAPATDTASSGLNGRLQRIAQRLTSLIAQVPATLGQKTSANSLAVVVASDQSAVPVSGTVTTTPPANASTNMAQVSGTATDVNSGVKSAGTQRIVLATDQPQLTNALKVDGSAVIQPVSGTVTTTPPANASSNVAQINGVTPLMGAGNTGTGSPRVTIATDQVVLPVSDNAGSLTVDSPVGTPLAVRISDGASFVTPARVDNQPFTDNSSNITPVGYYFDEVAGTALTENDAAVPRIDSKRAVINVTEDATVRGQRAAVDATGAQLVAQQAATATLANVAGSASSVTLQAANTARKGLVIVNDSTAILYVKFGSSASTTSFTYYLAGSVGGTPATLELPPMTYTGIVTGIWASAVGAARVTELT